MGEFEELVGSNQCEVIGDVLVSYEMDGVSAFYVVDDYVDVAVWIPVRYLAEVHRVVPVSSEVSCV